MAFLDNSLFTVEKKALTIFSMDKLRINEGKLIWHAACKAIAKIIIGTSRGR
jgi:hypothetical protein